MGEGKSVTEENSKNLLAEGAGKYELPLAQMCIRDRAFGPGRAGDNHGEPGVSVSRAVEGAETGARFRLA